MKKRVVIVDDHVSLRQMLMLFLSRETEFEVVGEAGTGLEAIEVCQRLQPEIVILDLLLPGLCGKEVLRRLRVATPQMRILIYSGSASQVQIVETLRCRPHGFVEKSDTLQTLREGLHAVASGCSYFTPFASALLADSMANDSLDLTPRESEVLQMVAEGRRSKEIAGLLGIAPKTVENHRSRLMDKLHLHDIAALTRYAVRRGLVE